MSDHLCIVEAQDDPFDGRDAAAQPAKVVVS
jgi:hypothetical protein